jgi:NADH-quinone oxidoreductase subunit A
MLTIFFLLSLLYLLSFLLSLSNPTLDKLLPYECGLEPILDARGEFHIIYYIIGLLYLIFDLEIIFLYPIAASLWFLNNMFSFLLFIIFFIIITLAFIYEWYAGVLNLS